MSQIKLPNRYEDLDPAFHGKLVPDRNFIAIVNDAFKSMQMGGGVRFLPVYAPSGTGKSSATFALQRHLQELKVIKLPKSVVLDQATLRTFILDQVAQAADKKPVFVVDNYEFPTEVVSKSFVELVSEMDRDELRTRPTLFVWISHEAKNMSALVDAAQMNKRLYLTTGFEILGPNRNSDWADVIEETFRFHNNNISLADSGVTRQDIDKIVKSAPSLGEAISVVGGRVKTRDLRDMSKYRVILLWPFTDGVGLNVIRQFSDPRQGYKLDWSAFEKHFNKKDLEQLPLAELNQARMQFDFRLVPIRAADVQQFCGGNESGSTKVVKSHVENLKKSHFYSVLDDSWQNSVYGPMKTHMESDRSVAASKWYSEATSNPGVIHNRLAAALSYCGFVAKVEEVVDSDHSQVRADVAVTRDASQVLIELKVFSAANTTASTVRDSIKSTLRKYAQLGGHLQRQ
jgi:hypothetical protein